MEGFCFCLENFLFFGSVGAFGVVLFFSLEGCWVEELLISLGRRGYFYPSFFSDIFFFFFFFCSG